MKKHSLLALVVAVAAVAAVFVGTSSALAADVGNDHVVLSFSGDTGPSLTPPIPPIPLGAGQPGTYSFSGSVPDPNNANVKCTFNDPTDGLNQPCSGTITSAGTYLNAQCGTGTATGSATITGSPADESPITVDYAIAFVAGQGTLTITGGGHADGPGGPTGNQHVLGNAVGDGTVTLTNEPGESCAPGGTGATGFLVNGTASVTLRDA